MPIDYDPIFRWCTFTFWMMAGAYAWAMLALTSQDYPLTCWSCHGLCLLGCLIGSRRIAWCLRTY